MSPLDRLAVELDVTTMPSVWGNEAAALSLGLQSGRDHIIRGTERESGVRFNVEVGVKEGRDGNPDFTGPVVHGRPGVRFLYLSWGYVTDDSEHEMFRRLKLYLSPVTRKDWSAPGVTWAQVRRGSITASVPGADPAGTPHCGTAQVRWT